MLSPNELLSKRRISVKKLINNEELVKQDKESIKRLDSDNLTGLEFSNGHYWIRLSRKSKPLNVFDYSNSLETIPQILEKTHSDLLKFTANAPKQHTQSNSLQSDFFNRRRVKSKKNNQTTMNELNHNLQKTFSLKHTNLPTIQYQQPKAPISYYKVNKFFVLNKRLGSLYSIPSAPKIKKTISFKGDSSTETVSPKEKEIFFFNKDSKIAQFEKKLSYSHNPLVGNSR